MHRSLYVVTHSLACLLSLAAVGVAQVSIAHACDLPASTTKGTVVRVLDGETLLLDSGQEARLVGLLAPRAPVGGDGTWPYEDDAKRALALLVEGKTVDLRSSGRELDRYGRLLAGAVIVNGADAGWVQEALVRSGQARVYVAPGSAGRPLLDRACYARLLEAERLARDARSGLWASSVYAPRDATQVRDLLSLIGQFAIVEGRVVHATMRGRRVYLNFGEDWRRDFTVLSHPPPKRGSDDRAGNLTLEAYQGKRVRVRGWLARRNGPMIETRDLGDVEVLREGKDQPLSQEAEPTK